MAKRNPYKRQNPDIKEDEELEVVGGVPETAEEAVVEVHDDDPREGNGIALQKKEEKTAEQQKTKQNQALFPSRLRIG